MIADCFCIHRLFKILIFGSCLLRNDSFFWLEPVLPATQCHACMAWHGKAIAERGWESQRDRECTLNAEPQRNRCPKSAVRSPHRLDSATTVRSPSRLGDREINTNRRGGGGPSADAGSKTLLPRHPGGMSPTT